MGILATRLSRGVGNDVAGANASRRGRPLSRLVVAGWANCGPRRKRPEDGAQERKEEEQDLESDVRYEKRLDGQAKLNELEKFRSLRRSSRAR